MTTPPLLIGVSGKARNGKDTVASVVVRTVNDLLGAGAGQRIAFADALRIEAKRVGVWDGIMPYTAEGRTALQQYGTGQREKMGRDYWVNQTLGVVDSVPYTDSVKVWVIPDTRFWNEAEAIRGRDGLVWRTARILPDGAPFPNGLSEEQQNHVSETELDAYRFDAWFVTSTVDELESQVYRALLQALHDRPYLYRDRSPLPSLPTDANPSVPQRTAVPGVSRPARDPSGPATAGVSRRAGEGAPTTGAHVGRERSRSAVL